MFDRREFLKTSTLVGVGTAATACAGRNDSLIVVPPSTVTAADMETYLARLDRSMHALSTEPSPMVKIFPAKKFATTDPVIKTGEDLLRSNLRSLLLVGSFRDLPEEGRAYPGMQNRLWNAMGEMDDAMRGMNKTLTDLTPTERADIGRALRDDPELGMRIVEAFDVEAEAQGLSMERRLHMRSLAVQSINRLKQSSSMFIDEYTTKTQKILTRAPNAEDVQRQLLATLGEEEFFALHKRNLALAERWRIAQAGSSQYPVYAAPAQKANSTDPQGPLDAPGMKAITVGAILLGVGLVVFLVCVAIGTVPAAFGATAGAILGIGGLITLIVGAAIRAAA